MTVLTGSVRTQYDALLTALQSTGERVGLGKAPEDVTTPYAVLFPSPGSVAGTVRDPFADATLSPQITYIGGDPLEAMWLLDTLRPIVLGLRTLGAGRAVMQASVEISRPIVRDDDVPGSPLFYAIDVYRIDTTPA